MLVNAEELKHLNGFYKRPGAREVVFKMYNSNCQVCGRQMLSLSEMWVGHRTPQSHWEYFEDLLGGQIDIDNLLNLQPEHKDCNLKKSNSFVASATLIQSALDQAVIEVRKVLLKATSHEPLGLELRFDLSSAVVDGPNPDWIYLSLDTTDNIVREAFKAAAAELPEAYIWDTSSIVIRASFSEVAIVEVDRGFRWFGEEDSAFIKNASTLWERGRSVWLSSGRQASIHGQRRGWYIFPHTTDLKNLRTMVFSPDHQAARNLQSFSSWIESGQCSKSGVWVCKGEYVNKWDSLQNQFHDFVYDFGPFAEFEVAKGRAKLNTFFADGDTARESFRRLFAEDEHFRKGHLEDGAYSLFDSKKVRTFVRMKKRRIKELINAPTCQQGAFGT